MRTGVVASAAAVGALAAGGATVAAAVLPGAAPTGAAPAPAVAERAALAASSSALRTTTPTVSVDDITDGHFRVAHLVEDDDLTELAERQIAAVDKAGKLAEKLAELHREQARVATLIDRGGVDGWIAEALQVLDLPQSLAPGVKKIIMAESGGNPKAINRWDSNARAGTPSQGLMQTIPVTFDRYVHPELADRPITDPVANITAGIRYMIDRYGLKTLKAGGRSNANGAYIGY